MSWNQILFWCLNKNYQTNIKEETFLSDRLFWNMIYEPQFFFINHQISLQIPSLFGGGSPSQLPRRRRPIFVRPEINDVQRRVEVRTSDDQCANRGRSSQPPLLWKEALLADNQQGGSGGMNWANVRLLYVLSVSFGMRLRKFYEWFWYLKPLKIHYISYIFRHLNWIEDKMGRYEAKFWKNEFWI